MKRRLRVLLVDDQKLFADSLKQVLAAESEEIGTVQVAADGQAAVAALQLGTFDLVLMDIHMPVMNGLEAVRAIHARHPEVKILMLTTFGYDEYVKAALENGAVGFLLKDLSSTELIAAIRAACDGLRVVSPGVLAGGVEATSRAAGQPAIPSWFRDLTSRERDILVLVMKGYSNEEIASRIFLGHQTVKNYLSSIYEKLGVANRFQAMRLAMEHKIDTLRLVDLRRDEPERPGKAP